MAMQVAEAQHLSPQHLSPQHLLSTQHLSTQHLSTQHLSTQLFSAQLPNSPAPPCSGIDAFQFHDIIMALGAHGVLSPELPGSSAPDPAALHPHVHAQASASATHALSPPVPHPVTPSPPQPRSSPAPLPSPIQSSRPSKRFSPRVLKSILKTSRDGGSSPSTRRRDEESETKRVNWRSRVAIEDMKEAEWPNPLHSSPRWPIHSDPIQMIPNGQGNSESIRHESHEAHRPGVSASAHSTAGASTPDSFCYRPSASKPPLPHPLNSSAPRHPTPELSHHNHPPGNRSILDPHHSPETVYRPSAPQPLGTPEPLNPAEKIYRPSAPQPMGPSAPQPQGPPDIKAGKVRVYRAERSGKGIRGQGTQACTVAEVDRLCFQHVSGKVPFTPSAPAAGPVNDPLSNPFLPGPSAMFEF